MKLFLVRHGETEWNLAMKFQGHGDSALTPRGVQQAGDVAKMLEGEKIDIAFCSDLGRARRTAEEILKGRESRLVVEKNLRECDYGSFEGLSWEEVEGKFREQVAERKADKYRFRHEGGESYEEMERGRIAPFIRKIMKRRCGTALIVAHAGTNKLIIGNMLKLKKEGMMRIWQPNDCVYIIDTERKTVEHMIAGEGRRNKGCIVL